MKATKSLKQLSQISAVLLIIGLLTGCSSVRYYSQAIGGQLSLMTSGESVAAMISSPDTSDELWHKLFLAGEARSFARQQLRLPVGDAYTDYVELENPWVVVNLVVAPEFSLTPHHWCYPVVGCQAYRGYFHLEAAQAEQEHYREQGYDTFLGGVTAYSTLGWFDDPLHTGFTRLPDNQMVSLIFHELAHRVLYIPGDTAFNESFATAVELEGLKLWLNERDDQDGFQEALSRMEQREQTQVVVDEAVAQLTDLYDRKEELPPEQLKLRKAAIMEEVAERYETLASEWTQPGPLGEDPRPLNNARLALFRQYNQYVPGFRQLLADHDHDFKAFYEAVEDLSDQPEDHRKQALSALAERFDKDL